MRIDPQAEPAALPEPAVEAASSRLITFAFHPPQPRETTGEGKRDDYAGPLLTDLRFPEFTSAALIRIVREVYLQMHLLAVGFYQSVRRRSDSAVADRLLAYQATGIAGVAADRIRQVLGVDGDARGLAQILDVHPLAGPTAYTGFSSELTDDGSGLIVRWDTSADGFADDTWLPLLARDGLRPLAAAAQAVDPRWTVDRAPSDGDVVEAVLRLGDEPAEETEEVAVTRISTGAAFTFGPERTPLPITPV